MAKKKRKQSHPSKTNNKVPVFENKKQRISKPNESKYKEQINKSSYPGKEFCLFFLIIAVIFLINSLEPDNKGETGVIGIIMLFISIFGFTYTRR